MRHPPNNYLYSGEQFDSDLGLYYNRARYLNTSTGRFWSMDTYDGDQESPLSLHRYLYAASNPVTYIDPSGNEFDLGSFVAGLNAQLTVYALEYPAVFKALSIAVGILAPVEIQAVDPTFDFEAVTGISIALEQARQLGTLRKAYLLRGGFAKLGSGFEAFIGQFAEKAEGFLGKQVRIIDGAIYKAGSNVDREGSAIADYLFSDFLLEVKLSAQAALNNTNQLIQYAKFSKETGVAIRYIFLQKPSPAEVEAIEQIVQKESPGSRVILDYLFD